MSNHNTGGTIHHCTYGAVCAGVRIYCWISAAIAPPSCNYSLAAYLTGITPRVKLSVPTTIKLHREAVQSATFYYHYSPLVEGVTPILSFHLFFFLISHRPLSLVPMGRFLYFSPLP